MPELRETSPSCEREKCRDAGLSLAAWSFPLSWTEPPLPDSLPLSYSANRRKNFLIPKLLGLVPEDLRRPELTADWEMKLLQIAKGSLSRTVFMQDIRRYSGELIDEIKQGEGSFGSHPFSTLRPLPFSCAPEKLSASPYARCRF